MGKYLERVSGKLDQLIDKKFLELIEQAEAELRGKDNEIEVLKWRVKYLEQFKPKEDEVLTTKG